jgi:uncharacterized DUF497 family protein
MFDWDDGNRDHVRRHGVEPEEAEEAVNDPLRRLAPAYNTPTERRRAVLGSTNEGRILFVVMTDRAGRTRVLSARDADEHEKRRFRRRTN